VTCITIQEQDGDRSGPGGRTYQLAGLLALGHLGVELIPLLLWDRKLASDDAD
jgi:hypothetical protein